VYEVAIAGARSTSGAVAGQWHMSARWCRIDQQGGEVPSSHGYLNSVAAIEHGFGACCNDQTRTLSGGNDPFRPPQGRPTGACMSS
jgi:hypothetical protein